MSFLPPRSKNNLQRLLQQAVELHSSGQMDAAYAAYRKVISLDPRNFDGLHLMGVLQAQQGHPKRAIEWIQKAIAIYADHPAAHANLGNAYKELQQYDQALACLQRALKLAPDYAKAHAHLGHLWLLMRQPEQAISSLNRALELDPQDHEAWSNLGVAFIEIKKPEEAIAPLEQAIQLQPSFAAAHANLGSAKLAMGKNSEALEHLQKAISLKPTSADALTNMGALLKSREQFDQALEYLNKAIAIEPHHADAYSNKGLVLFQMEQHEGAMAAFAQAIALNSNNPDFYSNLGNVLLAWGDTDQALAAFDNAIKLDPGHAHVYANRGNALAKKRRYPEALDSFQKAMHLDSETPEYRLNFAIALSEADQYELAFEQYQHFLKMKPDSLDGYHNLGMSEMKELRFDQAIDCFNKMLAMDPQHAEAHFSKSLALLVTGNYKDGWKEYEWRWAAKSSKLKPRTFAKPRWQGHESLIDKTIFIYQEQGLGDTIQFVRYIEQLKQLGARVIFETPQPLLELFSINRLADQLIPPSGPVPEFDFHCALMSLPLAFDTEVDRPPSAKPYLKTSEDKRHQWSITLGAKTLPRVGLVWSGNANHLNDQRRSVALEELFNHLPTGIEYISLQKEIRHTDISALERTGIRHFGEQLLDFTDTAALCDHMDLIISVDTSVAHLAAALGRPTWILLPFSPDWRWLMSRSDSIWYETIRLFRQDATKNWANVLAHLTNEMARFLDS